MFEPDYYLKFLQFMPGNIKALENTVGIPEVGLKCSMDFGGIFLFTFLLLAQSTKSLEAFYSAFVISYHYHTCTNNYLCFLLFQSKQNQQ